jgi:hypothetical protein
VGNVKLITRSKCLVPVPAMAPKTQLTAHASGIFHPLGAAFYSNASFPETLKVINTSGVPSVPFLLAGGREEFTFNWTTGNIEPVPPLSIQFIQAVAAELPRYVSLWQEVFAPISGPGYKVSTIDESGMPY